MNKYQTKTVIVEAEQVKKRKKVTIDSYSECGDGILNHQISFIAMPGDWLVYTYGSQYAQVVPDEDFKRIYEPVDE